MKNLLIDTLTACGFVSGETLLLQGTINPGEAYPETFVTFWTDYTADGSHYENEADSVDWSFTVILYSSDPVIVNTKPAEIRAKMKAAGFIPQGKGNDIPSDEATHTGWAMEFIFREKQ